MTYMSHIDTAELKRELARREAVKQEKVIARSDPRPKRPSAPKRPIEPIKTCRIQLTLCDYDSSFYTTLAAFEEAIMKDERFVNLDPSEITIAVSASAYCDDPSLDITASATVSDPTYEKKTIEYEAKMVAYLIKNGEHKQKYEQWKADEKEWKIRNGLLDIHEEEM